MIKSLPHNTVERLSLYRRHLLNYPYEQEPYIHSHKLAHLIHVNPAHVRRDLMLIGFTGDVHKGYHVKKLIDKIGESIDSEHTQKVAFIGIGDLGRAVAEYFNQEQTKLKIVATFRTTAPPKTQFPEVNCYHISNMKEVIEQEGIELIVLAVPRNYAKAVSELLVETGVKGILNFTSAHIKVPDRIYVENYDIIAKLEKLSFFTNTTIVADDNKRG